MKYIKLNKDFYLEPYTPSRYFLVLKNGGIKWLINDSSYEILIRLSGNYSYDEIINDLAKYYSDSYENVKRIIDEFLVELNNLYNIKPVFLNNKTNDKISVIGNVCYYPKSASVEITEQCNIRCLHCYGCFGEINKHEMKLEDIKKILFDLNSIGVKTIELTGGDISTYKNLKDVIIYALNLDFYKIDLLTNGIALKKEIMDLIIANRDRIEVQIDLHSLKDDYLYWFTNVKNSLNKIKSHIQYLADNKVRMRIATIITEKNLHEMDDIAEWIAKRNIKWGIGLVEKIGRANINKENLYLNKTEFEYFVRKVEEINLKYPNMVSIIDYQPNDNNCGAMTTHVVIKTNGDIKLCTMDDSSCLNIKMGNCINDNVKNIYDNNMDIIKWLVNYKLPDDSCDECNSCEEKNGCRHCLLRHFINVKEKDFKCKWFINNSNKKYANYLFGV